MRKNVVSQLAASGLLVTTLCSSFLPSLVMAQSIEQSDASTTLPWALEEGEETQEVVQSVVVEEDVQAPVVEVTPEVAGEDPQTDGSDKVTKKEIKEALENISGLLDESANVEVTKDADSAAIVETAEGVIVDLPKDPSDAVVLSSTDAPAIEITLPQADESKKAKTIDDGVVAYPGRDGSANAIQATEDGGVKMLTVIDNAGAPIEYTYGITVPEGGRVELTSDGGAIVLDIEGQPIAMVATPWAVDAAGVNVDTYFTTDGVSLTQHILHNVEGISYPVTADPFWIPAGLVSAAIMFGTACALSALESFGEDFIVWIIKQDNWYWSQRLESYMISCGAGMLWGVMGYAFLPTVAKNILSSQVGKIGSIVIKKISRYVR